MTTENLIVTVYGRKQICASCVGAPGSKDTYEWLQAAIGRKYNTDKVTYEYIDMDLTSHDDKHLSMIEQMEEEDMFYPLVLMNDEIVAEGIPNLKLIFREIDERGVPLLESK
ncbi:MAG TPA: YuzD family protein [Pseudogracilibacillus sp.]|nr:YuzD family protein [Pseudogracilibacillus sp.]